MNTQEIFNRFWVPYSTQNPSAMQIHEIITGLGEKVIHDHIALRTFNDPRINMDVIMRVFTENGYEERGQYEFKAKKLLGRHYEHKTNPEAPKVFVSELLLEQCSEYLQTTIRQNLDGISQEVYKDPMLVFQGSIWGKVPYQMYERLRQESEYAAWTLVYGFRANHFAIKVNALKNFKTLQQVNQFIKDHGFLMNVVGGSEIYGAPEELLEQSSTKAEIIPFEFIDGVFEIPSCFYEFTLRYNDANGKQYSGFIAANADKIFESTNFYKKQPGM